MPLQKIWDSDSSMVPLFVILLFNLIQWLMIKEAVYFKYGLFNLILFFK